MKGFLRWLTRILAAVISIILVVILLPYASRLASAVLPDLSGAALNTSLLLSHEMKSSARLETNVIVDEGIMNSSTNALFLGEVQSVTMKYTYRASVGIDLSKVQMKVRGNTITLTLPPLEILSDSLTPDQVEKNDFWYPLTEERRQKLLEDELNLCRERCVNEYASSDEAWQHTLAAMGNTVSSWLTSANSSAVIRYERGK
ncbi:MAG: DUF4230 domain-containing protein [Clostridia bacterium]|nr:DUF4230 domain-containing protein [Clostridia bacterium]